MNVKSITLAALLSASAGLVHAQSGGIKGPDMKSDKAAAGKVHKASGKVTRIDPAKPSVTIAHGPVASMNWPSMTMAFTVKDKALMDKLAKDKEVDFEFRQEGRNYVVTGVK